MTTRLTVSMQVDVSLEISDEQLSKIADERGKPKGDLSTGEIGRCVVNDCDVKMTSNLATMCPEIFDLAHLKIELGE